MELSFAAPLAGRDELRLAKQIPAKISIHAPLAGRDHPARRSCRVRGHFNPRAPCGVRPHRPSASRTHFPFQSTHPLRGATRVLSIVKNKEGISIHAPLAGCDGSCASTRNWKSGFQSTHPLRGATRGMAGRLVGHFHFNPRTPCGVRRTYIRSGDFTL